MQNKHRYAHKRKSYLKRSPAKWLKTSTIKELSFIAENLAAFTDPWKDVIVDLLFT